MMGFYIKIEHQEGQWKADLNQMLAATDCPLRVVNVEYDLAYGWFEVGLRWRKYQLIIQAQNGLMVEAALALILDAWSEVEPPFPLTG